MPSAPRNAASSGIDLLIKLATMVTCVVGVVVLYLTIIRDADQSQDKKRELEQKAMDLFHKQTDIQRARESAKADFLQKNLALLTSSQDGILQAEALIDATFTLPEEAFEVKAKARHIRDSALASNTATHSNTAQANYKRLGFAYTSGGHYAEAALSFRNAVTLVPTDAQAWNALAYAQLHQGDTDSALSSISRAIELKPGDERLIQLVTINAAKILCTQDKVDDARTYMNVAIGMNPHILPVAKADGELVRLCGFQFG